MTSANLITRAGGIAPLGSDPQAHLDELSARHYRHAALGERVVCRLVSSTLAAAEDLSLEYHGFESPHSVTPVGRQQRKGLGFPAWALVNDPGRGSLALAVLKEFRTQARLARSRPGAAKDGFVAIAGRLAQSVPHFLPSYFEEAGRVFLEHGHAGMAAQMFGQARQAEKVHALEVDESLRRESDALVVDTGSGSLRLQEPPSLGELPGRHNLAVLARNPGMRCRWIARPHPGRTRSAVALALESQAQDSWRGRCNLGCDRLHASYFPALTPSPQMLELPEEPRPFAELTRAWQRVALAGRSALCGRGRDALAILLQRRGQRTAATLWRALCQAAGQGQRDLLGLWRPGPAEEVSRCWLALHVYLQAASREWSRAPGPETATDQSGR
jgi:hypothetical protein